MFSKLSFQPLSRLAAVLSLAAVAALPAVAQEQVQSQPQPQPQPQPVASSQTAMQNLELFSSSAASQDDAVASERENLGTTMQFGPNPNADPQYGGGYGGPPRRRPYGRPTYKDRWTNSDGSSKVAFEAGAGPTSPAGAWGHYRKTGYDISVGAGRNFNRAFGVLFQYDYAHMGVVNSILNAYSQQAGTQVNGSTHLWSLTLNPVINFSDPHSHYGAYLVAGGGFYRKMTVYTEQEEDEFGDIDNVSCGTTCHVSNNAGGLNGGLGFFYKFTPEGNAKFFAEARYTWVDNQPTAASNASIAPENNHRTGYFPVAMGIRF